jgi:hypothetical protein
VAFLALGIAAFGLSLLLAYAVGRSRRRVGLVLVGGLALLLVWILAGFAFAGDEPCHDCGRYLGRYMDPVAFVIWMLNALGWTLGALVGGGLRALVRS